MNNNKNLKKKIVIIGAGWYGLQIYRLLKDKYSITILEKKKIYLIIHQTIIKIDYILDIIILVIKKHEKCV